MSDRTMLHTEDAAQGGPFCPVCDGPQGAYEYCPKHSEVTMTDAAQARSEAHKAICGVWPGCLQTMATTKDREQHAAIDRALAAARAQALAGQEQAYTQSQADMWREAARVANTVVGAGYVVSYCVDRAIVFEDRLRRLAGGSNG